jgi:hypothetical protein
VVIGAAHDSHVIGFGTNLPRRPAAGVSGF